MAVSRSAPPAMLFAFRLDRAVMLAPARRDATPIRDVLDALPAPPKEGR